MHSSVCCYFEVTCTCLLYAIYSSSTGRTSWNSWNNCSWLYDFDWQKRCKKGSRGLQIWRGILFVRKWIFLYRILLYFSFFTLLIIIIFFGEKRSQYTLTRNALLTNYCPRSWTKETVYEPRLWLTSPNVTKSGNFSTCGYQNPGSLRLWNLDFALWNPESH